jgi:hypothetical protein
MGVSTACVRSLEDARSIAGCMSAHQWGRARRDMALRQLYTLCSSNCKAHVIDTCCVSIQRHDCRGSTPVGIRSAGRLGRLGVNSQRRPLLYRSTRSTPRRQPQSARAARRLRAASPWYDTIAQAGDFCKLIVRRSSSSDLPVTPLTNTARPRRLTHAQRCQRLSEYALHSEHLCMCGML